MDFVETKLSKMTTDQLIERREKIYEHTITRYEYERYLIYLELGMIEYYLENPITHKMQKFICNY